MRWFWDFRISQLGRLVRVRIELFKREMVTSTSPQAVMALGAEFEDSEVAEDLELLADFVTDMAIRRMQLGEFFFRLVNLS